MRLLTSQPNHNIENSVVSFSLFQQPQYASRVAYLVSQQEASSSAVTTIGRGTDGGKARGRALGLGLGIGRGRGLGIGRGRGGVDRGRWEKTQVGNTNIQSNISSISHHSTARPPMSTMHSLPGQAITLPSTMAVGKK